MSRREINVKLKKLSDEAIIPSYAHLNEDGSNQGDVGMDLTAIDVEWNEQMDCYIYHTGLTAETAKGYGIFLFPRSSNRKTDCYLTNSVGVVDSTLYRGEILVNFKSRTSTYQRATNVGMKAFIRSLKSSLKNPLNIFRINKVLDEAQNSYLVAKERIIEMTRNLEFAPYEVGKKIAQMVVLPYPDCRFTITEELSETSRGEGGHGSTGE